MVKWPLSLVQTTGLGLFITLRYILEGMNVVADYVGELPKEFEDVQAKHADRVKFVKADVSNEEDIKALAETALKSLVMLTFG